MDARRGVERVLERLEDGYGELTVHHEALSVPRDMYVDCMNAASNDELGGVRVLVRHDDQFLLVKRESDDTWDAPGGSISRHESHESAARRYVAEQVGLECTITDAFAAIEREFTLVEGGDGVSGLWVFFEAETFDPEVVLSDQIVEAEWFSRPPGTLGPHLTEHLSTAPANSD